MSHNSNRAGFMELGNLIAVFLFGVLIVSIIVYYGGFWDGEKEPEFATDVAVSTDVSVKSGSLDNAAKSIVADLGLTQAHSKTGADGLVWGICFRNGKTDNGLYEIVSNVSSPTNNPCIGSSAESKQIIESTVKLPDGISLIEPTDETVKYIVFKKVTGETTSPTDIQIKIASAVDSRIIKVTPAGIITYSTDSSAAAPAASASKTTTGSSSSKSSSSAPSAPRGLVAVAGNGNISIAWDGPATVGSSSILEYRIYRSLAPSIQGAFYGFVAHPNTLFIDKNVTAGVTYYYRVSAKNQSFEGALSNEAVATVTSSGSSGTTSGTGTSSGSTTSSTTAPAAGAPSAPRNLVGTGGNKYVSLVWYPPTSSGNYLITEYRVYRGNQSGIWKNWIGTTPATSSSYSDYSVTNNFNYYYHIVAVNAAGVSPVSNEIIAQPSGPQ